MGDVAAEMLAAKKGNFSVGSLDKKKVVWMEYYSDKQQVAVMVSKKVEVKETLWVYKLDLRSVDVSVAC